MQITTNTTDFPADTCLSTDKTGRDCCITVIKGTFAVDEQGLTGRSNEQAPLVFADIHYGAPEGTSILYESDFAPCKPGIDVILNGHAWAPEGRPVSELVAGFQVGSITKVLKFLGDRYWQGRVGGLRASEPEPFIKMPATYEHAFGGSDHSHADPKRQGSELRNPVGAGYRCNLDAGAAEGTRLPNIEYQREPMRRWDDRPSPAGFGSIGRSWQPRIGFAGTYDDKWLKERFPFLPEDFDERYFQSAPVDQQSPSSVEGQVVRCVNLSSSGGFQFTVPRLQIPVVYRFRDRAERLLARMDTLLIEPDRSRFLVTWRSRVRLGRKLTAIKEILVGEGAKSALLIGD